MNKKGIMVLVLRGCLGSALGAFFLLATLLYLAGFSWDNWLGWLFVSYLFFGLPCGLIIGFLTALAILIISRQRTIDLGPLSRAVVGTLIAIIFWVLFFWGTQSSEYGYRESWRSIFGLLLFSTFTGAIAGLFIGRQRKDFPKVTKFSERDPQQEPSSGKQVEAGME